MGSPKGKLKHDSRNPLRIAFVHNMYVGYRLPLFQKLGRIFNITYFFGEIDPMTHYKKDIFNFRVLKSISFVKTALYNSTLSPTLLFHLLKGKYDLFIGCGMGQINTHVVLLVSRLTRKPFIVCEEVWYWPRTFLRTLVWPLVNFMLAKSDAMIVFGSKARELLISLNVDSKKIFVAPNASICVFTRRMTTKKQELKAKLGIKNDKVVLYFGRLIRRKGVQYLIEAFARLQEEMSDIFLLIAGDGETREELEKLCKTLGVDNVLFAGFINEEQKALYYSLADVVVLPSMCTGHEVEVWGLVLNEAMSLGKPVIATKAVGAAYDLVENGVNGYIAEDRDVQALYNALRDILLDPDKLEKMGAKSKKKIEEKFTYSHMAQGFVRAVRKVTEHKH